VSGDPAVGVTGGVTENDPEVAAGEAEQHPRRRLMRIARVAFGLIAAGFIVLAIAQRWQEIWTQLGNIPTLALVGATAAIAGAVFADVMTWRAVLADLGSPLPLRPAARVMLLGQLGKYVPGRLWSVVAQMELANDLGVPRRRSATAGLVFNALGLGLGLLLSLVTLPALLAARDVSPWVTALVVVGPLGLVFLAPPMLTRLTNIGLRVLRRSPLEHPFTWPGVFRASGWGLVMWMLMGLHIWILGVGLGADPLAFALPALGCFAVAWSLGSLFILAPAGAGVRDVLIAVILVPALPGGSSAALTIALVSRLISIVVDVAAAIVGHQMDSTRPRRAGRIAGDRRALPAMTTSVQLAREQRQMASGNVRGRPRHWPQAARKNSDVPTHGDQ
jgi:glycosyltransferase 2 family protein